MFISLQPWKNGFSYSFVRKDNVKRGRSAAPTAILSYDPFTTMDYAIHYSYFFFFDQGTDHKL